MSAVDWLCDLLTDTIQETSYIIERAERLLPSSAEKEVTIKDFKFDKAHGCIKDFHNASDSQLEDCSNSWSLGSMQDTHAQYSWKNYPISEENIGTPQAALSYIAVL